MGTCIQLEENIAITSDSYQWNLAKKRTEKDGSVGWTGFRHYPSLKAACEGYVRYAARTCDATTVMDLMGVVDDALGRLKVAGFEVTTNE